MLLLNFNEGGGMGTKVLIIIISFVWLFFGFFIWPTPYHVEVYRQGQIPVAIKVNRYNGNIVSMKMNLDAYKQMLLNQSRRLKVE